MRILFCNKYNFRFSGTEAYLFDLMGLLRSVGHEVALFTMDWGLGGEPDFPQYLLPRIDFKQTGLPPWARIRQAAHAIYSLSARRTLRQAIRSFRPDVAHIRNVYHHLSPSILWELRSHHIPVLYQVNDFKTICPNNTLVCRGEACERCRHGAFWHFFAENCYEGNGVASLVLMFEAYVHKWLRTYSTCVDRVIAPTQFVRERLIDNGWNAARIDVIYHFQKVTDEMPRVASGATPILYFGRLSKEKGVADLIRAMQRNPEIQLRVAGEGPQRSELERLASHLRLPNVQFLGNLSGPELDTAIASSRFTVFPSHAPEVLGKSILESYAHARPVIATDLGSRRELVTEGKTGLLYRCGDHEELAGHIGFLHAHPEVSDAMGRAGRQLLRERHSPDEHLQRLRSIYESMLAVSRKRQPSASRQANRRKLRVAFIGGRGVVSKYSGVETFCEEVGSELARMQHDITVYCRSYFTPDLKSYAGMRLVRLPSIRTKHFETLVHTFLSTIHASFSAYDIVHYQCLGPALFSWIPRVFGKKTVVTVQGLDWQRRKWGRLAAAVLKMGEAAAVKFPNQTMVVSRVLQEYYRAHHHRETVVVPNGTRVRERCERGYLRSWHLERGNYLLFLGRLSPEKNCDLLIRAYERINTTAKLVLAGGSSYSDAYERELQSHASERVRFLDWVSGEALGELLTSAMLFILPSDLEGLSLALLDAMAAGLCVLVSDIAENREVVDGVGFLFTAGDEVALARMLQLLIDHPPLREEAGRAAKARVRQYFLWPDIARKIESEYFKILGTRAEIPCRGSRESDESLKSAA